MKKNRVHLVFSVVASANLQNTEESFYLTPRTAVSPDPFDTKASSNGKLLLKVSRNLMRKLWDLIDGRR